MMRWTLLLAVPLVGVGGFLLLRGQDAVERRARALGGRGSVLWDSAVETPTGLGGSRFGQAAGDSPLSRALSGDDPGALVAAMRAAQHDALVVDTRAGASGPSMRTRFATLRYVPGFRGLYLAPDIALYAVDPWQSLDPQLQLALATVARGILEGKRSPRLSSFPEPLRRVQHVEVMVMLRSGGRPRLWRSARGSSVGRALLTATRVAKNRWTERRSAMGEPLDDALRRMDVEVSLLQDDGRFGSRAPDFIERALDEAHGVAFERKGAWRYLLPGATQAAGKGSAVAAYTKLLADEGLDPEAFGAADLHPYRLAVNPLATSAAPPRTRNVEPDDEVGPVRRPDELLEPPAPEPSE